MRVLIGSPAFPPSLGGLERVVEQLATGFAACGDDVTVATRTPSGTPDRYPFRVVRCPSPRERIRWMRRAQVFLQANLALRDLWPLLVVRRPWVVSHHGLYGGSTRRDRVAAWIKLALSRRADARVTVSRFLAGRVRDEVEVIPNPFRDDCFRRIPGIPRDRDLLFVGRLVSDKGCGCLIAATARLAIGGVFPSLTIVGEGPERGVLAARARECGIGTRVEFTGPLAGEELARVLNGHRLLVVPSLVEEGFGVVALEGIACGCVVVGSASGGLPEAIGPCGRTFPAGDDEALAQVLSELLGGGSLEPFRERALQHLEPSRPARVVERYREVLRRAAGGDA